MKQKSGLLKIELVLIGATLLAFLVSMIAFMIQAGGGATMAKTAFYYLVGLISAGAFFKEDAMFIGKVAANYRTWSFVLVDLFFYGNIFAVIAASVIAAIKRRWKAFLPIGFICLLTFAICLGSGIVFPYIENGVNTSPRFVVPMILTALVFLFAWMIGILALISRFRVEALVAVLPEEKGHEIIDYEKGPKYSYEERKARNLAKLHDFRNQTMFMAFGGLLATITGVFFLLAHQIDRMYMGTYTLNVTALNKLDGQVFGFIVFVAAVLTAVIGGIVIYNAVPYIQKKDKLSVKKWFVGLNIALSILSFALVVFAFVAMFRTGTHRMLDANNQEYFISYRGSPLRWIPVALLGLISMCYNAVCFIPTLSVKTYMPEFFKESK